MNLRPYQQTLVEELRSKYSAGFKAPLLVLPTGGGKTFIFSYIAKSAAAKGLKVFILVHRQELLNQTSRSLDALEVRHGLIRPDYPEASMLPVQVASVQTLSRRLNRGHYDPGLIIVDEAHHATAGTWRKILDRFPTALTLGVTATPVRTDGHGLKDIFDCIVEGPTVRDLISEGFLVKPKVYGPPHQVDLTGVKRRGGDYDAKDLTERVDRPKITGDVISHYRKLADRQPAIAFCVSVAHAQHVAAQFRDAGYTAVCLDGSMHDAARRSAIEGLANGSINVLTSCDIISEGTDIPVVSVAILLRPTQSTGLFLQQVGRALRPAPNKEHAIILDHAGNCMRHGMPDEDREWSLDGEPKTKRKTDSEPTVKQCDKCYHVYRPAPRCPNCGHTPEIKDRKVTHTDGDLIEITEVQRQKRQEVGQARTLEALIELAKRRGYSPGWAYRVHSARSARGSGR